MFYEMTNSKIFSRDTKKVIDLQGTYTRPCPDQQNVRLNTIITVSTLRVK